MDPDDLEALGLYCARRRRTTGPARDDAGARRHDRRDPRRDRRLPTAEGDLFGSVLNLAARLETLAQPGQAFTDAATAGHLGPDQTEQLGHRSVAGFDDPVEVDALTR
jgi:hypothetical protein